MRRRALYCALLVLAACGGPPRPAVEDLGSHENLSIFKLGSLRGTRDGDRLDAQAMFTDSSSMLIVEMRFVISAPNTTLESGTWRWTRNGQLMSGTVTERSVTFLGGQSGPPSIGGTFDLHGPDGAVRYRVAIPVTELKARLKLERDRQ